MSWGCHNKLLQTKRLFSHSSGGQGHAPSKASGEDPSVPAWPSIHCMRLPRGSESPSSPKDSRHLIRVHPNDLILT